MTQEQTIDKIYDHIEKILLDKPDYTGKVEINFKDGCPMDIQETKRTKLQKT